MQVLKLAVMVLFFMDVDILGIDFGEPIGRKFVGLKRSAILYWDYSTSNCADFLFDSP